MIQKGARTLAAGKALAEGLAALMPALQKDGNGPKFCSYKITQEIVAEHSL
jgi:hypothetical protein